MALLDHNTTTTMRRIAAGWILHLLCCCTGTDAFLASTSRRATVLWASTKEIADMRAGEIKQELESYGISTKSFLEKKELVEALTKAREDGLKPKETTTTTTTTWSSSTSSSSSSSSSSSKKKEDSRPREERLAEEIETCSKMRNSELKKELESLGISTSSFFEKSEFVQALAEARVDGKQKTENYAEYSAAQVEVLTDDSSGPRKRGQEAQPEPQSPFGGGSPFGGTDPFGGSAAGGSPFGGAGGMGGMGGIADMLKNMGMGGAGGASPFGGGMGGMGDAFGKAQQMMSNPKVQEIMRKAQSNPKVMAKVQECMGNPAAFAKYQNDPEVSEILSELKKYM